MPRLTIQVWEKFPRLRFQQYQQIVARLTQKTELVRECGDRPILNLSITFFAVLEGLAFCSAFS
ncbi:MAG: hypothetical protein ACKO1W_01680, partial [Microcystaceae cyanobacterium]